MALSKEMCVSVPQVRTSFFTYSNEPTARIGHVEALSHETLEKNFRPNVVTGVDIDGHLWSLVAVLSPYSQNLHAMLLDFSGRYLPDMRFLSDTEGIGLMAKCGRAVGFQEKLPDTRTVNVGYNWSPRSYGREEEKGGGQSLTTLLHIQLWNQPEITQSVPLDSLKEGTKRAILGNDFNRLFGMLIEDYVVNNKSSGQFLDLDVFSVDSRGIEVPVKDGLKQIFARSGFFTEFLKPLAIKLDKLARDMTESFSDMDNTRIEALIKRDFETGENGILPELRADPHLLPFDRRLRKIQELAKEGYGPRDIRLLSGLNRRLKDRGEVSVDKWFRKGLGYSLVFSQDLISGKTILRIKPLILVGDQGGVVEALGVALVREKIEPSDPSELARNKQKCKQLRQLGVYLQD